jgi:hypothetical protein
MARKSLSDILLNGERESLSRAWGETKAAEDYGTPLPASDYTCHLVSADLFNAQTKGTPGVKLAFKVIDGEHVGRRVWHDCWLTPAALAQSKRDLLKLGIDRLERLEQPLPQGIRCVVRVTLRKDDDGNPFNRVKTFTVVGIDEPEKDAFAPGDALEPPPDTPVDASFDPAKLDAKSAAGGAT